MTNFELELAKLPIDDFSRLVLEGASRVVVDESNPIRLNLFAAAIRELYGHTLHRLAPDDHVQACVWFTFELGQTRPTRRQRAKYATQGGLADDFVAEAGVDVENLHDAAIDAVNQLSKYTHVRPGTIVANQADIDTFVHEAFAAFIGLFTAFAECRERIQEAIFEHVNNEAVSALLTETILSLDEIATHHSIEEIYVDTIHVTEITHETVVFGVTGSVSVELQWGSGSDVRRDDGALLDQSFPFRVTMKSPVDDITRFEETEYVVDTSSWWDGYYDDGDL